MADKLKICRRPANPSVYVDSEELVESIHDFGVTYLPTDGQSERRKEGRDL